MKKKTVKAQHKRISQIDVDLEQFKMNKDKEIGNNYVVCQPEIPPPRVRQSIAVTAKN